MRRKVHGAKRMLALLAAGMLALTACGAKEEGSSSENRGVVGSGTQDDESVGGEAVVNDGYEKFMQLQIGMTESEVNAILGEPVEIDKAYYTYRVTVNGKDMDLDVWINTGTGLVTYLAGDFAGNDYRDAFSDSETDLSGVDRLESGELDTYEACVEAFKTPGYLLSVNADGVKWFFWVNSKGGYIRIKFRADGTVQSYNGLC